jgi:hypothetical protein
VRAAGAEEVTEMSWDDTTTEDQVQQVSWVDRLDAQYADLMETVWACERAASCEDRIDAVVRYGQGR